MLKMNTNARLSARISPETGTDATGSKIQSPINKYEQVFWAV